MKPKQIWLSLMVMALFSPVFLSTGSADFRPAFFQNQTASVPFTVWGVLALIAIFVGLAWVFAGAALKNAGGDQS